MIRLEATLAAWGTDAFREILKREIEALDSRKLPLVQALARGSYALDRPHEVVPLSAVDLGETLRARVGVFFTSQIVGCSCADDPTPIHDETEYCVLVLDIDKKTAETRIRLEADSDSD